MYEFDVVGHPQANNHFSVTFPYHPYRDGRPGGEVTVLREYCQVSKGRWRQGGGGGAVAAAGLHCPLWE